jgi:hypothetical protein
MEATAHARIPRQAVRTMVLRSRVLSDNRAVVVDASIPKRRSKAPSSRGTGTDGWFSAFPLVRMINPFRAAVPNKTPRPLAHRSTVYTAAGIAARNKGQPKTRGRGVYPSAIAIPPEISITRARNISNPRNIDQPLPFAPTLCFTLARTTIIAAGKRAYRRLRAGRASELNNFALLSIRQMKARTFGKSGLTARNKRICICLDRWL